LKGVKEIAVVFDPRDVLLVTATVPPLTGARLEQALPNLIEDALLQDPAACRIALGPDLGEGRRVLGVVDREWYDLIVGGFARQGIRVVAAWPAPLTIPWREGTWSIAWVGSSLTIRLGPADGFGVEAETSNLESSAAALLALAQTTIPFEGTVNLYADDAEALKAIQSAVRVAGLVGVTHPMAVPVPASIDLQQAVAGRSRQGRPAVKVSWPRWRWPLALGALCAMTAIICLNLQWGLMSKESAAIEAAIEQRVRTVLPARIPIVDASLQMQRRLDVARIRAGEPATDDATALLTRLAAALGPRAMDALISADYRDGRLRVRFQPGWADAAAARESLREAAGRERLRLQFEERDPVAIVSLGS
jgi:general secretion pathway protein L